MYPIVERDGLCFITDTYVQRYERAKSIKKFQKHKFPSCQMREVVLIYYSLGHQLDGSRTK